MHRCETVLASTTRRVTVFCKLLERGTDPGLEGVVEHVADLQHSAARPLTHAAEIGVVPLGAAAAGMQRLSEGTDRAGAQAVPLRERDHYLVRSSHVPTSPSPIDTEAERERSFPGVAVAYSAAFFCTPKRRTM